MTFRITLLPSNHSFALEGTETLLDAALRAGYSPDYGCSSGNCGLCQARVVSGTTSKIRHHDFSPGNNQSGTPEILLCAYSANSDLVLEVDEAGSADDIPVRDIRTRIRKVDDSDPLVTVISLQTPRTQRLRFLAGQSIDLQCGSGEKQRFFVASCPCDDRNLQLHVSKQNPHAHHSLATCIASAPHVDITGPYGNFTLNEQTQATAVFIALDDGFAPAKSLIEHAIALDYGQPVILLRVSSSQDTPYMHNLCRSWADALDNFTYIYESGFSLNAEGVDKIVRALESRADIPDNALFYLTGTPEFAGHLTPALHAIAANATVVSGMTGDDG